MFKGLWTDFKQEVKESLYENKENFIYKWGRASAINKVWSLVFAFLFIVHTLILVSMFFVTSFLGILFMFLAPIMYMFYIIGIVVNLGY